MRALRLLLLGLMVISVLAGAQRRRDPLTRAEVEELRDATELPEKRIKLLVEFARSRMLAIAQMHSDPRLARNRGEQIHRLLGDFAYIVDELDANLDMYHERQADLRKPLKEVIEADSEFQLKLRTLKEAPAGDEQAARDAKQWEFVLEDAIDAVNANIDNARSMLEEQNERHKDEKEKKKEKKEKGKD